MPPLHSHLLYLQQTTTNNTKQQYATDRTLPWKYTQHLYDRTMTLPQTHHTKTSHIKQNAYTIPQSLLTRAPGTTPSINTSLTKPRHILAQLWTNKLPSPLSYLHTCTSPLHLHTCTSPLHLHTWTSPLHLHINSSLAHMCPHSCRLWMNPTQVVIARCLRGQ